MKRSRFRFEMRRARLAVSVDRHRQELGRREGEESDVAVR